MKVAIVAEMLMKFGGAERVVEQIWKIFPDADIFTLIYDEKECGHIFPKNRVTTSKLQKWINRGVPKQFLVSQFPNAIENFNFEKYDLVISSNSAFAHGLIVNSEIPHFCYAHAPMRYAWDYTHRYQQEKTKGWKKILQPFLWSALKKLRIWDYLSAQRPDYIWANSKTTQHRIKKYWRRNSTVLYPPVDINRFSLQKNHKNFYFIVSMLEPFKKIDIAVKAFLQMPDKKLIIIGDGSQRKELEEISKNASNIQILGKKSDEVVTEHMQSCKAFIFPGLEDFGITPVEAMACGKPVVFFNRGGVTETVIDEKTGISFEKQTPELLCAAIEKLEKKYEEIVSDEKLFREQAEKFSIEAFQKNLKKFLTEKGVMM